MRIVAGSAKGVRLGPVPDGVRPLSDRAREGLFSSLGPAVAGSRVLDLFAGTGATGIEALSRGAAAAAFVDRSSGAVAAVIGNLERARVADRATAVCADALAFLRTDDRGRGPFDLVLCDPPYATEGAEVADILQELASGHLRDDTWIVMLSRGTKSSTPVIPLHWRAARELRYGDSLLTLFRSNDPPMSPPKGV
jgi:16S rRNA (guanine966-N2)-methyltransferase